MKNILLLLPFISNIVFAQNSGTFIDIRDNKVYKTVTIGNQIWFAENLAFEPKKGSRVYNNDTTNIKVYGRLYNWKIACEVCPTGWKLPSLDDYKILMKNINHKDSVQLFNSLIEGGASGFQIKFSGWRAGREYGQINEHTHFWTSTIYKPFPGATKTGYRFSLFKRDKVIYWDPDYSDYFFSVRCIKQ